MDGFSRTDLEQAFVELGEYALGRGRVIDVAVYGGSCLVLTSNFRDSSFDVDAVALDDQAFLDAAAREIAQRRGWPREWLNDGVRTYLSPNVEAPEAHEIFATYPDEARPGLRVFTPKAEYMLAMKLMSLRIEPGGRDLDDVLALMQVVGVSDKGRLVDFAAQFYPEARISGKLALALDRIWLLYEERLKAPSNDPPRYLGRAGPDPEG